MNILGISAFYHDSAAVLLRDGEIVAAAQEERFTRTKHDPGFPLNALRYCLAEGEVGSSGLDAVVFYDKPLTKFARIMETYFGTAPRGVCSFVRAMPVWLKQKLWIPMQIEKALISCGVKCPEDVYFTEHHEAHAASAFFPSPFRSAAVLTMDGVGEWGTSSIAHGVDNRLEFVKELKFPHSPGLLYSAFTYFAGFRVNSGEYKLMGLAPYGDPKYVQLIMDHIVDLRDDGSFRLNMEYFGYLDGLTMTNDRFEKLFGGPPRKPDNEITRREMDLARSVQVVTENIVLKMARHAFDVTGEKNLCMAGGVALNCVANGRILREGPFDKVWIQPAAGDAGGALGAAMSVWHTVHGRPRQADGVNDMMKNAYLGPSFDDEEIKAFLEQKKYPARRLSEQERAQVIAGLINDQHVVGLFQGRMEFGPRGLGNRSILGDARSPEMQSTMNNRIKRRESFRPFAPSCLAERAGDFFDPDGASPYMLVTTYLRQERRRGGEGSTGRSIGEMINEVRSDIPAVTHVDYSARVQTVSREANKQYYDIIKAFDEKTGYGIIINTSFNVRGEPIVCTPSDAYRCFMRTGMDYLVLGSFLLGKDDQPEWIERDDSAGICVPG